MPVTQDPHITTLIKPSTGLILLLTVLLANSAMAGRAPRPTRQKRSKTIQAMVKVYMSYGQYEKARPMAEKALRLAKRAKASDEDLAAHILDLAFIYEKQAKFDRAEDLCFKAKKLQEKAYYKDHPHIAYTLRILSSIYLQQGRYSDAQYTLDQAIDIMLKCHSLDDKPVAPFLVDMADVLLARGQYDKAQEHYQLALDVLNKGYGQDHPYTAAVSGRMAKLLTIQNNYVQARELIDKTYQISYARSIYLIEDIWLINMSMIVFCLIACCGFSYLYELHIRTLLDNFGPCFIPPYFCLIIRFATRHQNNEFFWLILKKRSVFLGVAQVNISPKIC